MGNNEKQMQATASSAHARINVPLNMDNWRKLEPDVREELLWYHQHLLDNKLSWDDAAEAVGYDRSTIFRWLKGTYEGSWDNAVKSIQGYRRIAEKRATIQANEIVENDITRMIAAGLDYALANNSVTLIVGESRMGKTVSALRWREANNHGTSVYVVAPPYGGVKMLMRRIADAVGVNKNLNAIQMYEAIARAFNRNRILIVDEAHRLTPNDRRTTPVGLEILRDLYADGKGCALAFIATQRFDDEMRKSSYQYEQIIGRIGMPIRLRRKIRKGEIVPLVQQYVTAPSEQTYEHLLAIANAPGRLGILTETLKVASRIANKQKAKLTDEHIIKAIALRKQMMGEHTYAQ